MNQILKDLSDKQLERRVLCVAINFSHTLNDIVEVLKTSEAFTDSRNKAIFEAILEITDSGQVPNLVNLPIHLREKGKEQNAGGLSYLLGISQEVGGATNIDLMTRKLMELHLRHNIAKSCLNGLLMAQNETMDVFDAIEKTNEGISSAWESIDSSSNWQQAKDVILEVIDDVESLSDKTTDMTGVPTGIESLDQKLGGYNNGDLVIIAGRPAMGKTSFALLNALRGSQSAGAVAVFSMEMTSAQLVKRLVSMQSDIPLSKITKSGLYSEQEWAVFNNGSGAVADCKIFIDDKSHKINDIKIQARNIHRKHNVKAIYIDYIQLIDGQHRNGSREQEISKISRGLKLLAMELKIPVVVLSQLSRKVEERATKIPMLSDLRESGAIEQDADIVMFVYRPEYYELEIPEEIAQNGGDSALIIAKNRNGSTGANAVCWNGELTKFSNPKTYF
jgi:replicative DNA helicase